MDYILNEFQMTLQPYFLGFGEVDMEPLYSETYQIVFFLVTLTLCRLAVCLRKFDDCYAADFLISLANITTTL